MSLEKDGTRSQGGISYKSRFEYEPSPSSRANHGGYIGSETPVAAAELWMMGIFTGVEILMAKNDTA